MDNPTFGRFRTSDRWASSTRHAATNYGSNQRVLARPLSVSNKSSGRGRILADAVKIVRK